MTRAALFSVTFCILVACAGSPSPRAGDHLHERITRVAPAGDGSATVEFERSQRRFRIDPVGSPNAPAMIAFATSAQAAGRAVHASIAPNGERTKGDDGPAFVLMPRRHAALRPVSRRRRAHFGAQREIGREALPLLRFDVARPVSTA